jgi:hypothetical protein
VVFFVLSDKHRLAMVHTDCEGVNSAIMDCYVLCGFSVPMLWWSANFPWHGSTISTSSWSMAPFSPDLSVIAGAGRTFQQIPTYPPNKQGITGSTRMVSFPLCYEESMMANRQH